MARQSGAKARRFSGAAILVAVGRISPCANPGSLAGVSADAAACDTPLAGIFARPLAVGAGLGAKLLRCCRALVVLTLVVRALVAQFAGIVQAPITAFVIVTTNDQAPVIPHMPTALTASATSRLVCREGTCPALATHLMQPASA